MLFLTSISSEIHSPSHTFLLGNSLYTARKIVVDRFFLVWSLKLLNAFPLVEELYLRACGSCRLTVKMPTSKLLEVACKKARGISGDIFHLSLSKTRCSLSLNHLWFEEDVLFSLALFQNLQELQISECKHLKLPPRMASLQNLRIVQIESCKNVPAFVNVKVQERYPCHYLRQSV